MFELTVESGSGKYQVAIGPGVFDAVAGGDDCAAAVADRLFAPLLESGNLPVVFVEATEEKKTLGEAERVMLELQGAGVRRGDHVLAVGGGVIQDLATLAAALYMRGLPWVYVPTTLMAMADSCIGGKSSINVGGMKNLAGNFHPPARIAVDPRFVATLPPVDVASGLAEAAKIAFCRGSEPFDRYLHLFDRFRADPTDVCELLHHVLDCKRWFVEVDEFDRKERRMLNFGHTFAHALEPATGFRVPHGLAVALGMLAAVEFAEATESSAGDSARLRLHCAELAAMVPDLPERLAGFEEERFRQAFRSDKKHTSAEFRLILPASSEGAREVGFPASDDVLVAALGATRATLAQLAGVPR